MNYNSDDEDGTESSIYDLDSAPPLPSGHNAHLHPDSSGPSSPNRRPRWSSSAPNMHNAAPARRRAHTSSVLPRRPSFASATSPTTTRSPSPVIKLPSAQSFPPPHRSKVANGKQVHGTCEFTRFNRRCNVLVFVSIGLTIRVIDSFVMLTWFELLAFCRLS